ACELPRRFEAGRISQSEIVPRPGELLFRDRLADGFELLEEFAKSGGGLVGLHGRAREERPRRQAEVEGGPGAVGIAMLLAAVLVQTRREGPAEKRVGDDKGKIVGRAPRRAHPADPDL